MVYGTERSQQILRIGTVSLSGVVLMVIERQLFSMGVISLGVRNRELWVMQNFTPAAIIVWLASVIFAGLWYVTALVSKDTFDPKKDLKAMLSKWVGFFLITLLIAIFVALYFYGSANSPTAFLWFLKFMIIDTILIYWISTAISTPGLLEYIVPGSQRLRKLLFIDRE
ncbi:hypothetical protein MEO94_20155 [Dolichospermum sp. ST_sed9]|jgi:hypothetical protein|nr:hypothetical protein [Dolichospermum sp. ST_sed9]